MSMDIIGSDECYYSTIFMLCLRLTTNSGGICSAQQDYQKRQNHLWLIIIFSESYKTMQAVISASLAGVVAYFSTRNIMEQQQKQEMEKLKPQPIPGSQESFFKKQTVSIPLRYINYPHFHIFYSTYHKTPLAVHELITKEIADGDAPRAKTFFPDDNIKEKHFQVDHSYFYQSKAYARFNYNRGHMAAAGNYSGKEFQKYLTFSFANILPQDGTNNGGIWNTFERYSRNMALRGICDSVEVISGPIFPKNHPVEAIDQTQKRGDYLSELKVLKKNGVVIPQKLFKIIKCNSKNGAYFGVYENLNSKTEDNDKVLNEYEVKLEKIEQQTGLKFNIEGKSLKEIDNQNLSKTKKDHDYPFYYGLLSDSKSVAEMCGQLRRAHSQHIYIDLSQFTQKIREMTKKSIEQLQLQESSSCQKLKRMVFMNRKLGFLKHSDQTTDLRDEVLEKKFEECKQTEQFEVVAKEFKSQLKNLLEKSVAVEVPMQKPVQNQVQVQVAVQTAVQIMVVPKQVEIKSEIQKE